MFVLCVGAAAASGTVESYVVDTLLLGVGVAATAAALLWGEAWSAVVTLVGHALVAADDRVNDLLFRQVFSLTIERVLDDVVGRDGGVMASIVVLWSVTLA